MQNHTTRPADLRDPHSASLGDIVTETAVFGPFLGPYSVLPLSDFDHPATHNLAELSEERERLQKEGSPGSESSCPFCGRS